MLKKEAVTIRFPPLLVQQAKQLKEDKESFNDLVIEALDREVKRRKTLAAHATILRLRNEVKQRTGVHPDPIPLIRQLREEENDI